MSLKPGNNYDPPLVRNIQSNGMVNDVFCDVSKLSCQVTGNVQNNGYIITENLIPGKEYISTPPPLIEIYVKDPVWKVHPVSQYAAHTKNPIREICDSFVPTTISKKKLIKLDLGDPAASGLFPPCPANEKAIIDTLLSHKYDKYGPATGTDEAKEAIVKHFSRPEAEFTKDDVILTSGCSHALQLAIEALANPGDNILIPCPGFPLYTTLLRPQGIQEKFYRIVLTEEARIDLVQLESLIDVRTRAIIINNPSNPLGAVYPKEHLQEVLKIAYKFKIPIISDEVYGDITFNKAKFYPLATLEPKVPILTCDAISKRYLSPGARLGWLIIHDRYGAFVEVRNGLTSLAQKIVGPCTLIQGALPHILDYTPQSFFNNIRRKMATNANIAFAILCQVPGLYPVKPEGALYMTVAIEKKLYSSDKIFIQNLIYEENVFCLPGSVFFCPETIRMALIYPKEVIVDACFRIRNYCLRVIAAQKGFCKLRKMSC